MNRLCSICLWAILALQLLAYNLPKGYDDLYFKIQALCWFVAAIAFREMSDFPRLPVVLIFDYSALNLIDEIAGKPATIEAHEYVAAGALLLFEIYAYYRAKSKQVQL